MKFSFDDLVKEVNLQHLTLQMPTSDGDAIIAHLRRTRENFARFNFKTNIQLFVGFSIFALAVSFPSFREEHMDLEVRAIRICCLVSGSIMYFLLLELHLLFPRRLSQQEWRQVRLAGYVQETLMIIVLVPLLYCILEESFVIPTHI
ncbi:hypothetical protein LINGRAHAP2_LOCUS15291 [Linum grandiflorum]